MVNSIKKKGQALPLNTIVIAILVVIVLLVIILVFVNQTSDTGDTLNSVKGCDANNPVYSAYEGFIVQEINTEGLVPECSGDKELVPGGRKLVKTEGNTDYYTLCCASKKE
jgi:hypothetical protein